MKEKALAAWEVVKAHWAAIVSIAGLLAVLLWRALRYRESITEGLQDYESGIRLQTEGLKALVRERELEAKRKQAELARAQVEAETKTHLETIQQADASHIAEEWNRLNKEEE